MNLLTRMMAFLSFFVMVQNVNAAGNSVYVDQIGDGSTINITQTGNSNSLGSANSKATFNGNNNTINIEQIGNSNVTNTVINGTGVFITKIITGNSNTDRKSTRLNSSHPSRSRMPSSA